MTCAAITLLVSAGCGADRLVPLGEQTLLDPPLATSASINFVTLDPQITAVKTCLFFIIDVSGSNVTGPTTGLPASDPTGALRFDSLVTFMDDEIIRQSPNTYYGLITFNDQGHSQMGANPPLINDATAFRDIVVQAKANRLDRNGTKYAQAFTTAQGMITTHGQQLNSLPTPLSCNYNVFHLSDGFPNDNIAPEGEIHTAIRNLVGIRPGISSLRLNTGYYFPDAVGNPAAQEAMRQVAEWGGGQALIFGGGAPIDYAQFVIPDRTYRVELDKIYLYNENVGWDGFQFGLDSDGDGLSDSVELRLRSSLTHRDTDRNGVSDLAESQFRGGGTEWGKPCKDTWCRDFDPASGAELRENFATGGCARFLLPVAERDPAVGRLFLDSDFDGLNDCEKFLLMGDNWENDRHPERMWTMRADRADLIPDVLLYRARASLISFVPTDNSDDDGLVNKEEIQAGTPLQVPNGLLLNYIPYLYDLSRQNISGSPLIRYNLQVHSIPYFRPVNTVHLLITESTQVGPVKKFMRHVTKTFVASEGLRITAADIAAAPVAEVDCSMVDGRLTCRAPAAPPVSATPMP